MRCRVTMNVTQAGNFEILLGLSILCQKIYPNGYGRHRSQGILMEPLSTALARPAYGKGQRGQRDSGTAC